MKLILQRVTAAVALAMMLSACAVPSDTSGETKMISGKTWGWYQDYLRTIGPSNPGAFAVSADGHYAYYYYCESVLCMGGPTYRRDAMARCRTMAKQDCYTFAFGREILVNYKVME